MKFGSIWLGGMEGNLTLQALNQGHEIAGASRSEKPDFVEAGVEVGSSPEGVAPHG